MSFPSNALCRPWGNPHQAILTIVGERPGSDELRTGFPFTGSSGSLLFSLLSPSISRRDCFLTNVSHSLGGLGEGEFSKNLPRLRRELEDTNSNVILALGNAALRALCDVGPISDWRGSILESTLLPGRKVIPTYNPAFCQRSYEFTYVLKHDIDLALRELTHAGITNTSRTFLIDPRLDEYVSYIREIKSSNLPISVDIETYRRKYLSCFAISDSPTRSVCLPILNGRLTSSELALAFKETDLLFRTTPIIGQNIQFDVSNLEMYGFSFGKLHFDTMLAHHLLYPSLPHDLGFLCSMYARVPYYKHTSSTNLWNYNCLDSACTYEVYENLLAELKGHGQLEYFNEHVMGLLRPIMNMQNRGLYIDQPALRALRERLDRERAFLQLRLDLDLLERINVKSPKDMHRLLFDQLKLTPAKLTPNGKPAMDEESLRTMAYRNPDSEILHTIIDIRERRTLLSSFTDLEVQNGRYYANFLLHGTPSGRLSSRARGRGPQLQNIPPRCRSIFTASPGCILIQADLKRAEAMYVAFDAGCQPLIDIFSDESRDLYKEVASQCLGIPIEEIQQWQRQVFKQVVHASNYGMGPLKFVSVLRLNGIYIQDLALSGSFSSNKARAQFLLDGYLKTFPEIKQWQSSIRAELRATRTLTDSFGRKHIFLERMDDSLYRAALSRKPQATVVGITNRAVRLLDGLGLPIVNQVHDSIILDSPLVQKEDHIKELKKALDCPVQVSLQRELRIPIEIKTGPNWLELKEE